MDSCCTDAADSLIEAMDLLEDDRVECQKEVKQTIDESHVDADGQNDGLCEQQAKRPRHVLLQELSEVNFDLFLLRVNAPVLRSPS